MLKEKINEDLTAALKSGSGDIISALRFLFSIIKNKELEKRTKLSKENKPVEELEKLSELSDDVLESLCKRFRDDVFAKARSTHGDKQRD